MGTNINFAADAAKAGLVLGLINFGFTAIPVIFNMDGAASASISMLSAVALIIGIYYFGKKRAVKKGDLGNTFGEAFGFAFVSMFYAGIISGLGEYFINVHIAPEDFEANMLASIAQLQTQFEGSYMASKFTEDVVAGMIDFIKNPIVFTLSGIIAMMLNGGAIGLFVSPFLRRNVNIFIEKNEE